MGYAIIRTNKINNLNSINAVLRHNRREVEVASATKSVKNPKLIFPQIEENQKLGTYANFLNSRLKQTGKRTRKDAVRGVEVLLSFSKNSLAESELKNWVKDSVDFVAEFFGWQNIYDVQLHADELTPNDDGTLSPSYHLHALVAPIKDGRLCCKEFLGGKEKMKNLQTQYADKMQKYGLQRGKPKEYTRAVHKNSVDYHLENHRKQLEHEAYREMFGEPISWNLERRMKFYDIVDRKQKEINTKKRNKAKLNILEER
jgi:hypothetical protein